MEVFNFFTASFTIKGGANTLKLINSGTLYKIKSYSLLFHDFSLDELNLNRTASRGEILILRKYFCIYFHFRFDIKEL